MTTKLAKLLQLQVLARTAASPRPRTIHSRGWQPSTRAAPPVRRKSRPVLVCQWHPASADGRLECRWQIEPREANSDETVGEGPTLSETRPRRHIKPPRYVRPVAIGQQTIPMRFVGAKFLFCAETIP
jgi:hypothetical protein